MDKKVECGNPVTLINDVPILKSRGEYKNGGKEGLLTYWYYNTQHTECNELHVTYGDGQG